MAKSTAVRAEARFKQLCCLGLGGEAVMPALLRELHDIIPFVNGVFFYNTPDGTQLANIYSEMPSGPKIYLTQFHDGRDHEIPGWGWRDWSQTEVGAHDLEDILPLDKPGFHRTEFYNLVYRPCGTDRLLRLVIRENGHVLGSTSLYRGGDRPWTSEDKHRLERLEPFFAHALTHRQEAESALSDSGAEGLIIADATGAPLFRSREGERLLSLATYAKLGPGTDFRRDGQLPVPVVSICRRLAKLFGDDDATAAPVHHHRNVWGGFVFRAHWLGEPEPRGGSIAISIRHQQPLQVNLLRRVGELPLSRRQSEVAFHLANGESHDRIAERLGISRHTAIAHGRWIYNKLDIHNRADLVSRLLST